MEREAPIERSGAGADGQWKMLSRGPSAELAGVVESVTGYEEWSPTPLRRREVAQPSVTMIFNLGPPLLVGGAGASPEPQDSFVAGRIDLYGVTEFTGYSRGVQLDMTPLGARMLLGLPMDELDEVVVPLADVFGDRISREIVGRLADTEGWGQRFDLLEALIARRVAAAPAPAPDALWAWRRLRDSGGLAPIGSIAAELGCSRRHLSARFRDWIGVTPKAAARVLRFRRCVGLLERDDGRRFAEIATGCGYYDQAHMNREFRSLAGTTPGEFVAARLPAGRGTAAEPQVTSVQDVAAAVA